MPKQRHKPLRSVAARDALLMANLGVVWKMARTAFHRPFVAKAFQNIEEAFQAGMLGAIRAAELWNPNKLVNGKPVKADTYIANSALKRIYREAHEQAGLIRIPTHVFWAICGKQPEKMLALNGQLGPALRALQTVKRIHTNDDGREWLRDRKEDSSDSLISQELSQQIGEILERRLPPQMRNVIKMRFGIGENQRHTLMEIAKKLHRSKQRIAQIEKAGMQVLERALREEGVGG